MKKVLISLAVAALVLCSCGNNNGQKKSEGEVAATEQCCEKEGECKECCQGENAEGKECCGKCQKAEGEACGQCQNAEKAE